MIPPVVLGGEGHTTGTPPRLTDQYARAFILNMCCWPLTSRPSSQTSIISSESPVLANFVVCSESKTRRFTESRLKAKAWNGDTQRLRHTEIGPNSVQTSMTG